MGGAGDLVIVPDPTTFRILPWADRTGWILGDFWLTSGQRVPLDTRHLFRTALADLEGRGLRYLAGLEVEFYIFRLRDPKLALTDSGPRPTPPEVEALTHGFQYMSEVHLDEAGGILDVLRENILQLGLPLRTIEDEWGPGQCEFTFDPQLGLEAADTMLLFRSAVKQICRRHGYLATFMCKPGVPGVYSSGWHLHESLLDAAGNNQFVQPDGSSIVSPLARHFIGGLLAHAAATSPFSNPTVNGYKRLNMNPLAPNRPVWAHDNKAAYIRVIGGGGEPVTHIENRSGEPAANPYLFMASQVIAGLDGIDRRLDPGEPRTDPYAQTDLPLLPMHLPDALAALESSTLFREKMGGVFIDYFLNVKRQEVARFLAHVTDWEQREYFEAF
jgi:glutamine synthetase